MLSKPNMRPQLMAVVRINSGRSYFIGTAGTIASGKQIFSERWHKNDCVTKRENVRTLTSQKYVTHTITPARKLADTIVFIKITWELESKFEVTEWWIRVNTSLLAIYAVTSWKLFLGCRSRRVDDTSPVLYGVGRGFYWQLAWTGRQCANGILTANWMKRSSIAEAVCGVDTHLIPTTRKQTTIYGKDVPAYYQARCGMREGSKKTSYSRGANISSRNSIYLSSPDRARMF